VSNRYQLDELAAKESSMMFDHTWTPRPPHLRRATRPWLAAIVVAASAITITGAVFTDHANAVQPSKSASALAKNETARIQRRLVSLHYLPADAVTGRWDYRTSQAIMAFQAWQGLVRDGDPGRLTRAALLTAAAPTPRQAGTGRVIEVFRAKGVTLLVNDSRLVRAVHSSSGKPGLQTPGGAFQVFRKERDSWSRPYRVWLPYASYFNGGIAFHGYSSVPPYPASHGCIRIPTPEAAFVYAFAKLGTRVVVY
jgi:lipoprotein-anchoring transpeptidase ErfK/SrfK